jgi:hypothetical protein
MIELLLATQAITTAALAVLVIKLRRELYPMFTTAGPADDVLTPLARLWIRSVNVLVVETPQFEVSKTVIRTRWAFTEELLLRYGFRVYDIAIAPTYRDFYKEWKEWKSGSRRYDCRVRKPRWFAKIYNKAIEIVCFKKEEEKRPREVIIPPSRVRKRGKRIIEVY